MPLEERGDTEGRSELVTGPPLIGSSQSSTGVLWLGVRPGTRPAMSEFLVVLGLAALPALANFAGGGLAEVFEVSARSLSLALHLAAGIVLALVGLELMPEALQANPPWPPLVAFVAGGAVFIGLDRVVGYVQGRLGGEPDHSSALAIFGGVSMDLFSDGIMIGTGTVLNPALGLLLALGQMPADLPEGFAAVATLRRAGIPRKLRLLMAAAFAIPILLGAALGFLALRGAPEGRHPLRTGAHRWRAVRSRGRGDDQRSARGRHLQRRADLLDRRVRTVRRHLGVRRVSSDGPGCARHSPPACTGSRTDVYRSPAEESRLAASTPE